MREARRLEQEARKALAESRLDDSVLALAAWCDVAPCDPSPRALLAQVHLRRADEGGAASAISAALRLAPSQAGLWRQRARLEAAAGKAAATLRSLLNAIALAPPEPRTWLALAQVSERLGDRARLRFAAARAAGLDGSAAMRRRWAEALLIDDMTGEAERRIREAIALAPADGEAVAVFARLLNERLDHRDARRLLAPYLRMTPWNPRLWQQGANAATGLRDMRAAIRDLRRSLALSPGDVSTYVSLGLRLLNTGAFIDGWSFWEWRLALPRQGARRWRRHRRPFWRGQSLPGGTLLIWPEQGVGDEIQLAECLFRARPRVGSVVLECDPRLVTLFARSFPWADVRPERLSPDGAEAENTVGHAAQIPIGSLPALFYRRRADFPAGAPPLVPDAASVARWRHWLYRLGSGIKIGISWRSGLRTTVRRRHMLEIGELAPVLRVPGVTWVNLQYGECEAELTAVEQSLGLRIHRPPLDLKDDLDGAAALMSALGLVVSPGTAVANIAAAVGAATWIFDGPPTGHNYFGTARWPLQPHVRVFAKAEWIEPWSIAIGRLASDLGTMAAVAADR